MYSKLMKTKLKQLRVDLGLTQAKLAEAVGVSQPNYQRWEVGSAPIPDDKLKKLAKVLKTSAEVILGRHPPINAGFYDDSVERVAAARRPGKDGQQQHRAQDCQAK